MKQLLLMWGILIALTSCRTRPTTLSLEAIFNGYFDHKMISSGNNFPDFHTRKDSLDLFLVALHEKIPVAQFQKRVAWSDSTLRRNIAFLKSKNWLVNNEGLKPTIFIATDAQGKSLFSYGTPIAMEIAQEIEKELNAVKTSYSKTTLFKTRSFEEVAFLILSDVLLDNWQINVVEREFLMAEQRPERHQKHYYYAIMENTTYPKEEFGIFGNQYRNVNDSTALAIYGNNRNEASKRLKEGPEFLKQVLQTALRISQDDNQILEDMANTFAPKLIEILAKHSDYMLTVYQNTGYAEEISFEEFFIWWYHFIYTDVTNMLAENGTLNIPVDGNFYYIIEE